MFRRLAAVCYDCLPVLALVIVATFPFIPFAQGRVLIPSEVGVLAYLYWFVQLTVTAAFFVYFWTTRGQTVGMLPWRLRLQRPDGSLMTRSEGARRFGLLVLLWAPFFAGYWFVWGHWSRGAGRTVAMAASLLPLVLAYAWIWIDRDGCALHDRWSGTRMVLLPKRR